MKCNCCNFEPEKSKFKFTTGYATLNPEHHLYNEKKDNVLCFACCGHLDGRILECTEPGEKVKNVYYLSQYNDALHPYTKRWKLTNWPGTFEIKINAVYKGNHNIAGSRYDFWFEYKGKNYHGVQYGEWTQVAHVNCIKNYNPYSYASGKRIY